MQLQEVAKQLGIDLPTTLARFGGKETLYLRFLKRIPEDPTFEKLADAVERNAYEEVEREAHTLKGVAANLGLEPLRDASDALVATVRQQKLDQVAALFAEVEEARKIAVAAVEQLD